MLSGTFVTKVTLQHFLYPTGVNTNDQQNQNLNQQTSSNNRFQYIAPNTKDVPVYGVRTRIGASDNDPGHNGESCSSIDVLYLEEYPLKNRIWSSQKNTIGMLRAIESR